MFGEMNGRQMEIIHTKYYDGFEGEPEIQFIFVKGDDREVFTMWEKYFDQIMGAIVTNKESWTGLAYYYNLDLGWNEESPWKVDDLCAGLNQFQSIDKGKLSSEATEILEILCDKFSDALENRFEIFITKE